MCVGICKAQDGLTSNDYLTIEIHTIYSYDTGESKVVRSDGETVNFPNTNISQMIMTYAHIHFILHDWKALPGVNILIYYKDVGYEKRISEWEKVTNSDWPRARTKRLDESIIREYKN